MKKILCLLLAAMLLCIQASACAESGYMMLRAYIEDETDDCYSTELTEMDVPDEPLVVMLFMLWTEENNLFLLGRNDDGVPEATLATMELPRLLANLAAFCSEWDEVTSWLDEDCQLSIRIQFSEEEAEENSMFFIETAEDAAYFDEIFNSLFDEE